MHDTNSILINESQIQPLLTFEEFLSISTQRESDVAFQEFLDIWNHSSATRKAIQEAVHRVSMYPTTEFSQEDDNRIKQNIHKPTTNLAVNRLIELRRISSDGVSKNLSATFGGLSLKQLFTLLERYKAGKRSTGTYLLAKGWKKESSNKNGPSMRLKRLTLRAFQTAILENRGDFFRELAETVDFLQSEEYEEEGHWDHDPGQWWQFHVLLYIFENPKEKYPIREFVKHFEQEVGTNEMPTPKTIRAFCRKNGIALDSRPGAPRKEASSLSPCPTTWNA